jgi:hypothetical protein
VEETAMKKWFQAYVDFEDEEESLPMRFDPDKIEGFRKSSEYATTVYTTFGTFVVREEYEKFCKRLFSFVNFDELDKINSSAEEVTTTTKKRFVVRVKRTPENDAELEDRMKYYDEHQPETNAGMYM